MLLALALLAAHSRWQASSSESGPVISLDFKMVDMCGSSHGWRPRLTLARPTRTPHRRDVFRAARPSNRLRSIRLRLIALRGEGEDFTAARSWGLLAAMPRDCDEIPVLVLRGPRRQRAAVSPRAMATRLLSSPPFCPATWCWPKVHTLPEPSLTSGVSEGPARALRAVRPPARRALLCWLASRS